MSAPDMFGPVVPSPDMSDRVQIGRVGRPHGLDGAFFVEEPSDDGRWFELGARLLGRHISWAENDGGRSRLWTLRVPADD